MEITASMVKELREKTNAAVMDCKKALTENNGDMEKAINFLRQKGLATASRKVGRITREGLVVSYIHPGGRLGVLLEINCETDFVAKNSDFGVLAKDLAMQIAATNPICVKREDLPVAILEKEKEIYRAQAKGTGKPDKIIEKIVEGKLEKYFSEVCLLEQAFVKDPNVRIEDLIKNYIAKFGENITLRRFVRYQLGENPENG
ncbi:MAG TPA: translation elongation factor Ts [Thermodesulfobacteriota bacterium]|nr:translation elongation factor Ts [Thermodesulfobacteriota bacterium]